MPADYHYRSLINQADKTFFILDCGLKAKSIKLTDSKNISESNGYINSSNYDVILLHKLENSNIYKKIKIFDYFEFKIDCRRILLIRRNLST